MSRRTCDKKCASLLWTLLECVFFSGVVLGWSWLALTFRADHYFLSECNLTLPDLTSSPTPSRTSPTPRWVVRGRLERRPCRKKPQPARQQENLPHDLSSARVLRHVPRERRLPPLRVPRSRARAGFSAGGVLNGSVKLPSLPFLTSREDLEKRNWTLSGSNAAGKPSDDEDVGATVPPPPLPPPSSAPLPLPHASFLMGGKEEEEEEEAEEEEEVCFEQREMLRLLLAVVVVLRDLFVFPVGVFFDKYGTTRTRLLTVLIFALGTLMMTFITKDVPLLMVPALTLTGVAGVAVLLTNVQIANMFGPRRHLVMALYCAASLTSGFITYMMQLSHEQGVHVQTSFMFLTIGLVPMLVSTVAFLPKTRVPWPLPDNYGQRRQQSLDENLLQGGVAKLRRPVPKFWPKGDHHLLLGAMLWHGVHSLHTAQAETLLVDVGHWSDGLASDLDHVFGWLQLTSIPLAFLPGFLIDRRRPRELGVETGTHQMRGLLPAMVLASTVALGERALLMLGTGGGGGGGAGAGAGPEVGAVPCLVLAFLLHALHRVTFLVVSLAFLLHVHFAQEHVGKYVGLTLAAASCISALQFPLRLYLRGQPLVAHSLLLALMMLTFTHVINVWHCCRRRLIRDRPQRLLEGGQEDGSGASGQALLSVHVSGTDLPGHLRPAQGTSGHGGACPSSGDCCPGPSGHHRGQERKGSHHRAEGGDGERGCGSQLGGSGPQVKGSGPHLKDPQRRKSSGPEETEEAGLEEGKVSGTGKGPGPKVKGSGPHRRKSSSVEESKGSGPQPTDLTPAHEDGGYSAHRPPSPPPQGDLATSIGADSTPRPSPPHPTSGTAEVERSPGHHVTSKDTYPQTPPHLTATSSSDPGRAPSPTPAGRRSEGKNPGSSEVPKKRLEWMDLKELEAQHKDGLEEAAQADPGSRESGSGDVRSARTSPHEDENRASPHTPEEESQPRPSSCGSQGTERGEEAPPSIAPLDPAAPGSERKERNGGPLIIISDTEVVWPE